MEKWPAATAVAKADPPLTSAKETAVSALYNEAALP